MLCVDDESLSAIQHNPYLLQDKDFLMSVLECDGDNAIFVRLQLKDGFNIRNAIGYVLIDYKSVSWYRNGRLYTKKGVQDVKTT
jgi:hypothetical protein